MMKEKWTHWLIAALCLPAILLFSATPGLTQEKAGEEKPEAAAKSSEEKASEKSDRKDEEAKEEKPDPYAVPDGDAKEMMAFIFKLQRMRPKTREEYMEILKKRPAALNEASDKLLAANPSDAQAATAVQLKATSLNMMSRMGNAKAGAEMAEFLAKMRKDEREVVSQAAVTVDIQMRAGKWAQLEEKEKSDLIDELLNLLGGEKPSLSQAMLVRTIAAMIERSGDAPRADELYTSVIPLFRNSDNPKVVLYADKFEGAMRKRNLVGAQMEVKGKLLDGSEIDWSSYRGKVVLVDYWATWCGPCVRELPNVLENYKMYHDKGFDVVGISLDDANRNGRERVKQFISDREIPWPILFSDDKVATYWDHPMANYYGINSIPAAILVDKEGKVITLSARGEALGKHLEELLGKPEGAPEAAAEEEKAPSGDS